jgi:hypothetical protein
MPSLPPGSYVFNSRLKENGLCHRKILKQSSTEKEVCRQQKEVGILLVEKNRTPNLQQRSASFGNVQIRGEKPRKE